MYSNNNRIIQFDVLRVVAASAVVLAHSALQNYYNYFPSVEWEVRTFYDSLLRWANPLFFMISGALFLDSKKKIDIKNLYAKNITRALLILIFWSFIYALVSRRSLIGIVESTLSGPGHFWFLKSLIGLYVLVPILRVIVADKKTELYFICLSLITAFFIPTLFHIVGDINESVRGVVQKAYDAFRIDLASSHVCFFVLGHYLANIIVKEKVKKVLCVLGILSVLVVFFITSFVSIHIGKPYMFFQISGMSMFPLIEATALFIMIKDLQTAKKYHATLITVSKLSLGIYILHPLVMRVLDFWHINSTLFNSVYFIPLFAFMVFVICCCITFVLIRIPVIKKLLM